MNGPGNGENDNYRQLGGGTEEEWSDESEESEESAEESDEEQQPGLLQPAVASNSSKVGDQKHDAIAVPLADGQNNSRPEGHDAKVENAAQLGLPTTQDAPARPVPVSNSYVYMYQMQPQMQPPVQQQVVEDDQSSCCVADFFSSCFGSICHGLNQVCDWNDRRTNPQYRGRREILTPPEIQEWRNGDCATSSGTCLGECCGKCGAVVCACAALVGVIACVVVCSK